MASSAGKCWSWLFVALFIFLLPFSLCSADPAPIQELVKVNVTTLQEAKEITEQVSYNISYDREQMHLNAYPLSKGVSRIYGKMNVVGDRTPHHRANLLRESSVSMRVLVIQWPMNESTGEEQFLIQQEVISIDGNQAKQNVTMEVKLVVNNETGIIKYTSRAVILKDTWLHFIPWDKDTLFTFPDIPQSENFPQDTTREYNVRQNTTLDEKQFTGELPETPLQAMIPSSSYKVMCQFADDLREKLCFFWKELYPILVRLVAVFVVGVITAALILELLKLVYPPRQDKGVLHLSDIKDSNILLHLMLSHDQLTVKALEAGSIL